MFWGAQKNRLIGTILLSTRNMFWLRNKKINFQLHSLFGLMFYAPVNSYGHIETVSSPNHTFSLGKLDYKSSNNQYFVHILLLVTDNPS